MSVRARHIIYPFFFFFSSMKDQRVLFVVSKVRTERLHGTENDVSHSEIARVPQQACKKKKKKEKRIFFF